MVAQSKNGSTSRQIEPTVLGLILVLFVMMLLRTAWIGDDAYFTMRTVDNFIRGYGLTWNIDERVQAYTHPLWMLALSAAYFLTREAFYTNLFVSIAASACAFWLVLKSMPNRSLASVAILLVLLVSRAFIDYSTSGLENPATHLLLAAFVLVFLKKGSVLDPHNAFLLGLIAGLATLNRMDTLLLYLPCLVYIAARAQSWRTILTMAVGFLPFVLWELFSIVYYGFPFPNSAYAKLPAGIGQRELISQGVQYFLYSLRWDPITPTAIAAAITLTLCRADGRERAVALGVTLYLAYVAAIGGDFMAGRFFSGPVLLAVVLLVRHVGDVALPGGILTLALVLALTLMSPLPLLEAGCGQAESRSESGIADIRAFYFSEASLVCRQRGGIEPHGAWAQKGLALRASGAKVHLWANGFLGFFAGPDVHLIDTFGLADPLLARLPYRPGANWDIGHFDRHPPAGYVKTIESGTNQIRSQSLAQYYDKLRLITSGPIWSAERLAAIWEINTGQLAWMIRDH